MPSEVMVNPSSPQIPEEDIVAKNTGQTRTMSVNRTIKGSISSRRVMGNTSLIRTPGTNPVVSVAQFRRIVR